MIASLGWKWTNGVPPSIRTGHRLFGNVDEFRSRPPTGSFGQRVEEVNDDKGDHSSKPVSIIFLQNLIGGLDLRVGRDANVVGSESAIESEPALVSDNLLGAVKDALVRGLSGFGVLLLLLQTRLDKVKREGHETGEETSNGGSGKGAILGGQVRVLLQLRLGFREEGQLSKVQGHGTENRGECTRPQSSDSLRLGDASQGIENRTIIGSSFLWFEPVGLHSNESQVRRVAHHGSKTASSQTSRSTFRKSNLGPIGLGPRVQSADEGVEETKTCSGVHGLSEQTSRQTRVEVKHPTRGDDLPGDAHGGWTGTLFHTLTSELQSHLDHVDGLHDGGGGHPCQTAVGEGERSTDIGIVKEGLARRRRVD